MEGGALRFRSRPGALTDALRARITANRPALIAHLAATAVKPAVVSAVDVIRVSRTGELPLSHNQQRLWFMKQLDPSTAANNIPAVLKLSGELNVPALERALVALIERHESLPHAVHRGGRQPTLHRRTAGYDNTHS